MAWWRGSYVAAALLAAMVEALWRLARGSETMRMSERDQQRVMAALLLPLA